MKLAQYETPDGFCIGIEHKGQWLNYTKAEALYSLMSNHVALERLTTLAVLLEAEGLDLKKMKEVVRFVGETGLGKHLLIPRNAVLKAPLMRPRKIVALGLNYVLHAKEGSFEVPEEPILFVKVGSSVVGPGDVVRIPRNLGRMDHEVELAVVIGKRATEVAKKDAYGYVAGYTIINDVSARSLQTKDIEKRHPWFRTKSFDTFTPMGPWMVTADEIRPPVRLDLECRVNGRLRQRANTSDLLFDIPTVIAFISKYITLDPGDVISTGTPAGIGPIRDGDTMTCTIQKIGKLTNPVRYR
jgi:5-oxopent-3-ene-1,2,5-tricarboxylate decarboxylase/2-hydroxyhepta-2,4-diene-1,7-dioate isomerase